MKKSLVIISLLCCGLVSASSMIISKSSDSSGMHSRNNSFSQASLAAMMSQNATVFTQPTGVKNSIGKELSVSEKAKQLAAMGLLGVIGLGECLIVAGCC